MVWQVLGQGQGTAHLPAPWAVLTGALRGPGVPWVDRAAPGGSPVEGRRR